MKTILFLIAIYFIGRFVFRFLLPGVLIFNKMKKQMDSMNRPNPNQKQDKISDFEEKGEYIEYEEIK